MIQARLTCVSLVFVVAACGGKKKDEAGGGDGSAAATAKAPTGAGAIEVPAVAVAAGVTSSCALMKDGGVRCWGRTDFGETGTAKAVGQAATPVAVPGLSAATWIVGGGDPGDSGDAFCVAGSGGKITCWGHPSAIPLGIAGDGPREIAPLAGARHLALGSGFGLAVMGDGTVASWGKNTFGQRGVEGLTAYADEATLSPVPGITGATQVATGQTHGCALLGDGTASCWGFVSKKLAPTPVTGATELTALSAAQGGKTCGVRKDATVVCWGDDLAATPFAGVTGVVELASRIHTCARTQDDTVWCWGSNWRGQVGAPADRKEHGTPAQVAGLTGAVGISVGPGSTCAVTKDGAAHCWGYNRYGQLGDGTLFDRHQPAPVTGLGARTLAAPVDGTQKISAGPAQSWDGLPADCKHDPLAIEWARVAGKTFPVESAVARVQGGGKTIVVTLSNHGAEPAAAGDARRGPQVGLSVRFGKIDLASDQKEAQPVDVGTYSQDTKQDRLIYVSAADRLHDNIMLSSLGLGGPDAGTVTLTKLDGGWVCGELAIKTKEATISGPFAAKVVD